MDEKMEFVHHTLLKVINIFVEATLSFYELDDKIGQRKLERELFINLITNFILEGQLYFLVINLTTNCFEGQMRKLHKIMSKKEIQENLVPITSLNLYK